MANLRKRGKNIAKDARFLAQELKPAQFDRQSVSTINHLHELKLGSNHSLSLERLLLRSEFFSKNSI